MKTSKSAFDFLMRNVKAKQQQQHQQTVESKIELDKSIACTSSDNDDEIIIINNNHEFINNNKKQVENIQDHEIIQKTDHIQQFS